ncbi:hypothetical protein JQK87_33210, partial [Streptomyces sp. G44]|nr:hypothetical protein [Streptomyces sp. G44]
MTTAMPTCEPHRGPGRRAGHLPVADPATGEVLAEALDAQRAGPPGPASDTRQGPVGDAPQGPGPAACA